MIKQNVTLKTHELEVIGQGPMVDKPCQVGEWWVMPADQYTGTIPPEIQAKWDVFKARHPDVLGYLIADDMRDMRIKWEKEAKDKQEKAQALLKARQEELKAIERERKARESELKRQEEKRRELARKEEQEREAARWTRREPDIDAGQVFKVLAGIVVAVAGIGLVAAGGLAVLIIGAAVAGMVYDPVLIAVMPDGRWACVAAWWD
jgi:hypothetical protein